MIQIAGASRVGSSPYIIVQQGHSQMFADRKDVEGVTSFRATT